MSDLWIQNPPKNDKFRHFRTYFILKFPSKPVSLSPNEIMTSSNSRTRLFRDYKQNDWFVFDHFYATETFPNERGPVSVSGVSTWHRKEATIRKYNMLQNTVKPFIISDDSGQRTFVWNWHLQCFSSIAVLHCLIFSLGERFTTERLDVGHFKLFKWSQTWKIYHTDLLLSKIHATIGILPPKIGFGV